jgi:hypothetical protein
MLRKAAKENGLSLFFLAIFLAALIGQAIAGHAAYNDQEIIHAQLLHQTPETLSFWHFITTSAFAQAVMENWQSEYLQFSIYVLATIWLLQKGSTESKPLDKAGLDSDSDQQVGKHIRPRSPKWAKAGGWKRAIYSNSLLLVTTAIFFASWFGQSVAGWSVYNSEQIEHKAQGVSWLGYVASADFWEATLQNWQSEFLAVGSMVIFTVYLRQRGSSQSKPVGAPHEETAVEG